jgi:hypothetical protein
MEFKAGDELPLRVGAVQKPSEASRRRHRDSTNSSSRRPLPGFVERACHAIETLETDVSQTAQLPKSHAQRSICAGVKRSGSATKAGSVRCFVPAGLPQLLGWAGNSTEPVMSLRCRMCRQRPSVASSRPVNSDRDAAARCCWFVFAPTTPSNSRSTKPTAAGADLHWHR